MTPPPIMPSAAKPATVSKKPAAGKRKPAARAPQNIRTESEAPRDTPTPPTMPVAEEETPIRRTTATRPRANSLEHRLAQSFASVAPLPALAGDSYSAFIIASRSEKFAHDVAELARVNPRVKKFLENMLDGGVYGGVIFSGAAMLLPILWAYGILPSPGIDPFAPFYAPVPPEVAPLRVRAPGSSDASRAAGTPPEAGAVRVPPSPGGVAPGSAPMNGDTPPGVVTVKPGAHPPMNPAAAQ